MVNDAVGDDDITFELGSELTILCQQFMEITNFVADFEIGIKMEKELASREREAHQETVRRMEEKMRRDNRISQDRYESADNMFEEMDHENEKAILNLERRDRDTERIMRILERMDHVRRTEFLEEMDSDERNHILDSMSREERDIILSETSRYVRANYEFEREKKECFQRECEQIECYERNREQREHNEREQERERYERDLLFRRREKKEDFIDYDELQLINKSARGNIDKSHRDFKMVPLQERFPCTERKEPPTPVERKEPTIERKEPQPTIEDPPKISSGKEEC